MIGLDVRWIGTRIGTLRSRKEGITVLEGVGHESTDGPEVGISYLVTEDELKIPQISADYQCLEIW